MNSIAKNLKNPTIPCLLSKSLVKVYIVDFFNIFSDFREIKYKRQNIDFHSIKHVTKNQDTYDFFKLFFTRYITYTGIKPDSKFYFIMKGLNDYDVVLDNIIKTHNRFDMKFVIIPDKFKNKILDKNKDDFLCQYFFYMFQKTNPCMLISNDKYRDSETYIRLFNFDLWIKVVSYNKVTNALDKTVLKINPCDFIRTDIKNSLFSLKRCAIPKKNLNRILD